MNLTIVFLATNIFIKLVILAIAFDTLLGCLRAIKTHQFNSSFGINGGIRKVAMIACILKNMYLCGLPVPKKLKEKIGNLLDTMTDELNIKGGNK
ncbi:phage holin family protein [Clostridioides difficile]|uniref:phage holin family protein n=1 Tax=Clostridioides difficile TaxID=1496 RepID=UPI0020B3699D|nr:phage holin family protein [Clostridioides difficile]